MWENTDQNNSKYGQVSLIERKLYFFLSYLHFKPVKTPEMNIWKKCDLGN